MWCLLLLKVIHHELLQDDKYQLYVKHSNRCSHVHWENQGHIPEEIQKVQCEKHEPQNYCSYFQGLLLVAMTMVIGVAHSLLWCDSEVCISSHLKGYTYYSKEYPVQKTVQPIRKGREMWDVPG